MSAREARADVLALLAIPAAHVRLVRAALASPIGAALLDLVRDEPEPVRVVAPSAPKTARAPKKRAEPEPNDDLEIEIDDDPAPAPKHKPGRPKKGTRGEGPYLVFDSDEQQLGEFRTKREAIDWFESDDQADTVLDGNGKVIARRGVDDDETDDETDDQEDDDAE